MEGGRDSTLDVSALMSVLEEHFTLVLGTRPVTGSPDSTYSTPLYYAHVPAATPVLAFASDPASRHGQHLGPGPTAVSAAIHREDDDVSRLRGVQLIGEVRCLGAGDRLHAAVHHAYVHRHPVAAPLLTPDRRDRLYALVVGWAKLTDNARLGLGHHASWTFPIDWDTLEFTRP